MVATKQMPKTPNSRNEFIITIILSLLPWVLPMNSWLACFIWILIGGLIGHLIWTSRQTVKWSQSAKIVCCLGTAAIIIWQVLGVLEQDKLRKTFVSVSCVNVLQPVEGRRGESLWTIFLHPQARNNQLVSFTFAVTGAVWPHPNAHGFGYKCEFIKYGGPISQVELALQVDFGSTAGASQNRTIEFGIPWTDNDKPFILYLANCTPWSPYVVFPETGVARMQGTSEKQPISFDLITRRIGGFGIFQETVQYPMFCGVDPKTL